MDLSGVRFDPEGLVPVVVQDARTGEVLTLAYANREALEETLRTGQSTFYSRSRGRLWRKGETSGNTQEVVEVLLDCDGDAVVYRVVPRGPACHTGERTCFHHPLLPGRPNLGLVLGRVYATIQERLRTLPEGSYVAKLHQGGLDRILKKIGEEAGEVIIAAKNGNPEEVRWEVADLLFHLLLVLAELGLSLEDLAETLWARHQPPRP
ncbi:bifunctional phosphoribosyl-AMP cyclohydrolase/phosphoribosyl-ATP diphosphatase HisIE [Thermus sp.]|uniref:bifunctional phosphoribosyl-AMP cyclohydrolase/phosphoribosyl-ATP diphosphatase HisIE n=1 Tax=Thermus sp. TaxID=275 RepID=UPI0025E8236E|nr:bifunctional phosphoribosyl-AMP cyclohydrolase/phosphoribosyl-ATP diphosphatase HisIE [Thermus sp.]MCS6868720.1 bifunctional phosphoribosyl-AMP cyclohydrolase/phosphoribosyl-ATP diphosphatase HisIE [Thermus sp.]MCX7849058.1 bifunctional phosphoribosyl-AMP cyclohydrolase/phosphoribosyl-ATP diphosphatase HisIE [Thermus sp.]MDW8356667.1 bifunctional phosphoribosyl-AMP cyclohydrolase/phosphoribosyl-ATP diphosphatase HisIE [Thermus sp.]